MVWVILAIGFLAIAIVFLLSRKTREQVKGICNYALEVSVHKQRNLNSVLQLFETKNSLTNEEIRTSLGVSPRSVVRYMDELEKQGKIRQTGKTGRGVSYSLP